MVGKTGFGVRLINALLVLVDGLRSVAQVREIAAQLFRLKEFLRVIALVPEALALDAVYQRLPLTAVDGTDRHRHDLNLRTGWRNCAPSPSFAESYRQDSKGVSE